MLRLTSAHLALVALCAAPGCFLSHELEGRPHPTPARPHDAGTTLAPDLGSAPDSGLAPACALSTDAITVSVEAVGRPTYCTRSHVDEITVSSVVPEPSVNGIRIHADYCPGADDDCRCDIVVSGVGIDVASQLVPTGSLTLDLSIGESSAAQFVALRNRATLLCDCPGCPCSLDLFFYAADSEPALAPAVPDGLAFSTGPDICTLGRCPMTIAQLHSSVLGRETDHVAGVDAVVAGFRLRTVRNAQSDCDPCPSCGGGSVGPPKAAWAMWRDLDIALRD